MFGSIAKGTSHAESDIDIAVVCAPFAAFRHAEHVAVSKYRWDIDLRIEAFCLHPEDLENRYSTIAQEVKQYGIDV